MSKETIVNDAKWVYPHDRDYAKEHGEISAYRSSMRLNEACADRLRSAVAEHYDGATLSPQSAEVLLQEFGQERVRMVLAAILQTHTYDQRYSARNQQWAATIPVPNDQHWRNLHTEAHPGLVDLLVTMVRRATEPQHSLTAKLENAQMQANQRNHITNTIQQQKGMTR